MDVLFNEGIESVNEIHYSDCREYTGEVDQPASMMTQRRRSHRRQMLDTPSAPVRRAPPGSSLSRIGLTSAIHSETAAAGDAVTGVILHAQVKDRKLGVVAREN